MPKLPRHSAVPWLEDADLRAYGPPETSVEYGGEIAHGLRILAPWGTGSDAMLTIRATRSGVIAMAITNELRVDQRPQMDMHLLSGTNRRPWFAEWIRSEEDERQDGAG